MTTRHLVSAAATIAAVLWSVPLAAQSVSRTPAPAPDRLLPSTADSSVLRGKAVAATSVTFEQFRTAMGTLPDGSSRLVGVRGLRPEHITLVDVRNLFRYTDDQKNYERALMQYERGITAMRATLQNSTVLRDLLYDRQLEMSQVIAVQMRQDGRGIVFYQPE